ncbi:MAG TPA: chemotaxis protein CheA [Clostridia bacterium]|nr:chemotaxis protein CheA [Clostridia bacterium]
MDMEQYMGIFADEAKEHLQNLNDYILELEKDHDRKDLLNEIFRSAHTLKGMAGAMGFEKMATLTHEMENVLDELRKGEREVNLQIIQVLFSCLDALEALVNEIITEGVELTEVDSLIDTIKNLDSEVAAALEEELINKTEEIKEEKINESQNLEYLETVIEKATELGLNTFKIKIKFAEDCLLKSARAFMVFRELDSIGEIVYSNPSVQDIEDEKFDQEIEVIVLTKKSKDHIIPLINNITDVKIAEFEVIREGRPVNKEKNEEIDKNDRVEPVNKADEHNHKRPKTGQTVRVDIERLDNLMNLVGELVISKTRLEQISLTNQLGYLNETIEQIDRITDELQSVVMKVRMVPVEQVFNRFPRMVRDLAKELSKEVELVIEGKETELDRTVIDEIGDPLVHLLRNALDHGIEKPEERLKAGKNRFGTIKLRALHEGNNVIIKIEDDGRGIDPQLIKRKALEKGVLSEQDLERLDESEILKLIFRPGFSTAQEITDISGRGVGLDVVKYKIESLGGEVELESRIGYGSTFTIRLPLTLAIIQALLVKSVNEIYAIPLAVIQETVSIREENIKRIQNHEVITLRGEVLPLFRLQNLLDIPPDSYNSSDNYSEIFVVVVRKGDKRAGLIVNELVGQQDIVIKSLGRLLNGIKGIAGATILGDGRVALILDIGTLF